MDQITQLEAIRHRLNKIDRIPYVGNWEIDIDSGTAVWSDENCRIYGLPAGDNFQSQQAWEQFIHEDDRSTTIATIEASKQINTGFKVHYRITRKDGAERHLYSCADYLTNSAGLPYAISGTTHDITDIIKLKTNLTKSEVNIRLIMDLIPLSIYARDAMGNYIFGNHVFLKHYGITPEQLKGKHMRDFVRNDDEYRELTRQDQAVLSSNEKLFVSEFKQTDHTGTPKTWRIIKVPFTPDGSSDTAILGIAEDITPRKEYEEALVKMSQSLSERNKELETFSFMVSHDLRGPLSTIMGISDLIKNVKLDQEDLSVFIAGIEESLIKLDNIIRVLNDVTSTK